ncbi:hypothetical protein [uncultured Deinococcus sp.]|uniref:GAP1-N1 domain-containing protein n=1 Tax=uncultured Deinococcus sp. TaxID=158789 RepID=UPI0025EAFCF5|nr:hypothetical protein [uncultured Deinococcus sp.]
MTDDTRRSSWIPVDQYLFGYQHGHRLLAGSRSIPSGLMRQIISRTDAPGSSSKELKSTLLQGFPLSGPPQYALARTWPDRREGARPGTVLTHLLLIDLPDLGREDVILPLLELLQADPNDVELDQFKLPAQLEIRRRARARIKKDICRSMGSSYLLSQLYALNDEQSPVIHAVPPFQLPSNLTVFYGAELFLAALWEQQWPRLRRSFSFVVTNWRAVNSSISRYPSDLIIHFNASKPILEPTEIPQWITALEEDLISPSSLRQFLRRAGADIKVTRQAMQPLVDLHLRFKRKQWDVKNYREIASIIVTYFPQVNDAKWIKQQLIDPSVWAEHTGFKTVQFISAILDLGRHYDHLAPTIDWQPLIIQAKQEDPIALGHIVAEVFDDDDVPLAEELYAAYLNHLNIDDLLSIIEIQPFLLPAAIANHPSWLEREELWVALPYHEENLLNALNILPIHIQNQVDWEKVIRNVVTFSKATSSSEWMRQIPLVAFEGFLTMLGDQELLPQWIQGLNARKDDVIHWMATQEHPPLALLLWTCYHVDYLAMWNPQLDEMWVSVARNIETYPLSQRSILSIHAVCTLIDAKQPDANALLQVIEPARIEVIKGKLSPRHHLYLDDHLPRTKKDRHNWDIGRRLDHWVASIFNHSGMSGDAVRSEFKELAEAKRLFRLLNKKSK